MWVSLHPTTSEVSYKSSVEVLERSSILYQNKQNEALCVAPFCHLARPTFVMLCSC